VYDYLPGENGKARKKTMQSFASEPITHTNSSSRKTATVLMPGATGAAISGIVVGMPNLSAGSFPLTNVSLPVFPV
jgi:hypothetical protein